MNADADVSACMSTFLVWGFVSKTEYEPLRRMVKVQMGREETWKRKWGTFPTGASVCQCICRSVPRCVCRNGRSFS